MNATEMWERYCEKSGVHADYEAWAFGGAPDELAELVQNGIKTATASAYPLYEQEQEPLPQVGEYNVILNAKDEAVCVTKTTKVYVVPFREAPTTPIGRGRTIGAWIPGGRYTGISLPKK